MRFTRLMILPLLLSSSFAAPRILAKNAITLRVNSHVNPTPIQHIIVIMQENRSFDSYFGTYPGANGIPAGVCAPLNPQDPSLGCVAPFHDQRDSNDGGVHRAEDAQIDIDDGITQALMDGFVYDQMSFYPKGWEHNWGFINHDVMGYHTAAELPNYWNYARNFVLQDNIFASERGYSLPNHLYLVSEWSAACTDWTNAMTCYSADLNDGKPFFRHSAPWASLFQLYDNFGVSWKYYVAPGTQPDCDDDNMTCAPVSQRGDVQSLWNPPRKFAYVQAQGGAYLAEHNPETAQFFTDLQNGTLPQVSWLIPTVKRSEHPTESIDAGMDYVTSLVNAVMKSPYWANTAIFITWDDWGGFYDHVVPPNVDSDTETYPIIGYGIRVPGIMISAYAKQGLVDHQLLSFDSFATLAENLFLGGQRLDPAALGVPDNRPDIRDALTSVNLFGGGTEAVGNLLNEFDFSQTPVAPLILSQTIPTNITVSCGTNLYGPGAAPYCTQQQVKIFWTAVNDGTTQKYSYNLMRDGTPLTKCIPTRPYCYDSPGPGNHYYTVYSIGSNNVASPASGAALAVVPPLTASKRTPAR